MAARHLFQMGLRPHHLNLRDPRPLAGALLLGVAVCMLAVASIELTRGAGRVAVVWPVNAVILVAVLRQPVRLWPGYLVAAVTGNVAANLWSGDPAAKALGLAMCNAVEVLVAGFWLRAFAGARLDVTRPHHLGHFLLAAGLLAPASSALPASLILASSGGGDMLRQALMWFASDALGLVVIVPLWTLLASTGWRELREDLVSWRGAAVGSALAAALVAISADQVAPIYFLIPPALVFAGFILRPAGVAVALTVVAAAIIGTAALGLGVAAQLPGGLDARLLHGQALLAVTTLSGLLVSAAVTGRRRFEHDLKASIAELKAARAVAERSEARYRLVADHASDIIARTSVRGEGLYLSPSVEDVTGRSAAELLANRPPFGPHIHPKDLPAALAHYRALAQGGDATTAPPLKYRFRHKSGRWMWLESSASVLRDTQGRTVEFIDVVRDITAHVELERALLAARRAAEAATEVKSKFIANMSHEIRTPLMAVLGFADGLAKRADLPQDAQRRIAQIQGAGRGLLAIANDVLDFSRLEAGGLKIRPQPSDVTQLCVDTLSVFEGQAQAKGLQLQLSVGSLPERLVVDSDRIRQILNNYVGNAIKFTDQGRVMLRAHYDGVCLRLEVEDTGAGLAPEEQRRLFVRFSQVDGASGRRHGGTGLGLAICKGLAEAMGGSVGLSSQPGRGSVFFAEVPAETAAAHTAVAVPERSAGIQSRQAAR